MNSTQFKSLKNRGETEKLYEFLKGMPKGGLLHLHLSGAIPVDKVLLEKNVFVKNRFDEKILTEKAIESLERKKINFTWLTKFLDKPIHSLISFRELQYMKIQAGKLASHGEISKIIANKFKKHLFRDYMSLEKIPEPYNEKVRESLIFREGISAKNIGVTTGKDYAPSVSHLHEEFEKKFIRLDQITKELPRIRRFLGDILETLWNDNVSYVELMFNPFDKVQRTKDSIRFTFGKSEATKILLEYVDNNQPQNEFELLCAEHILRRLVDEVNRFNSTLMKKEIPSHLPKKLDARFLIGLYRLASNRRQRLEHCFSLISRFHNHEKIRYKGKLLGINLVGNEFAGSPSDYIRWFTPLTQKYKNQVKISLHAGESSVNDGHVLDSILLHTDRIGHGISLKHSPVAEKLVISRSIPIEVNLLSNKFLGYVPNVESHPAKNWFEKDMKLCLNTDDPGLFETTLTDEFYYATLAFDLSLSQIESLVLDSIDFSFMTQPEKINTKSNLESQIHDYVHNF
jgi:adenosine deaminase